LGLQLLGNWLKRTKSSKPVKPKQENTMRLPKAVTLIVCILTPCLVAPRAHAQAISALTVLHNFGATNVPPENPLAPVVQGSDGTLYGTTSQGGINDGGTVFKIQTNGTGLTVLKYFTNSPDGATPLAGLVLSGSTLYGTTAGGGASGNGTVFAVNTDGTGYTNLYSFQGGSDGSQPQKGLILSGSTLFGTTYSGGSIGGGGNNGIVFAINTDGTGYHKVYNFTDGESPQGLILSGGTLYGATQRGGYGNGTVFAVNTDGTGFTNLYNFSALVNNTNSDGAYPLTALILSGGTLYGTATQGGTNGNGTIFAVHTDGTGFTNLYTFSATTYTGQGSSFTNSDGASPGTPLSLSGGTLYGATSGAGLNDCGTLFAIKTNGTGFTVTHTFTGNSDGRGSQGLSLSGGILYGTTYHGGSASDNGVIFSIATNSTVFTTIYNFATINIGGPEGGLVLSGGMLFGTTEYGGSANNGTVFAVNTNGTGYTILHSFSALLNNTNSDGINPQAGLVLSGGMLYGTANAGGANNGNGTVFAVSTNGTGFNVVHTFTGGSDGRFPVGGLIISGSTLYGTASANGSGGDGTVFAVDTSGSPFTVLHSFSALVNNTNSDGCNPESDLFLSGGTLYGTTQNGGTGGRGTLFAVNTSGTTFSNLYSFSAYPSSNTNSDGAYPQSGLALSGNTLYGTAFQGGSFGSGTLFAINTNGTGFTVLQTFGGGLDSNPFGSLVLSGRTLYGVAQNNCVFAINTDGSGYLRLYHFNGTTDGDFPPVERLLLSGSTLYGTTHADGPGGNGTVFALKPLPTPLNIQSGNNSVVLSWLNPLLSLQSTPVVTGTFTNMPVAYSPYTNTITAPQQFFRLTGN
jgi:uncharacterized repeat protein (TIGR03803 family)